MSQAPAHTLDSGLIPEAEHEKLRKQFPILSTRVHDKPLVYLDNAATTLKPLCVVDTIANHYAFKASNVHRGVHFLSESATSAFEAARDNIANFINAAKSEEVIFTRGTTESINLVAQSYGRKNFEAGDEIIISEMEHHSNIVPWQMVAEENGCRIRVIPINDAGELNLAAFKDLLGPRTRMVAVSHVSNTLGTINPIKEIIQAAHEHNVPVLIDGAQAVAHMPVDVRTLDCDFYVFSAHKLFGPTGIGVLYGKAELLNSMPPVLGGGNMIDSVSFEKTTYNVIPHKFEAGTPHIAGVIGFGAAVDFVRALNFDRAHAHVKTLLDHATAELQKIPGVRLIGTAAQKSAILSFVIDGVHPHDLGTLVDMEGVAIRTGHHCTQPLMKRFGVNATARASFAVYNTLAETEIFVNAVKKARSLF